MEINQLRYFHAVAQYGSFTAAAKKLRVSQPSISKMIKQLEDYEGVKLLDRGKKGVRLTPMGNLVFDGCQRLFSELEALQQSLDQRKDECTGELWLGASDNLCNYGLPTILKSFLRDHPTVNVKLISGTSSLLAARVLDCQLEFALYYTPIPDAGLISEAIAKVPFVMVSARSFSMKDLPSLGYVGSIRSDYQKEYPALKMLKGIGIDPRVVFETNNQETQKRMVLEGIGYTLVPRPMVQLEIANGKLFAMKAAPRLASELYLVKRKNRSLSRTAESWRLHLLKQGNFSGD